MGTRLSTNNSISCIFCFFVRLKIIYINITPRCAGVILRVRGVSDLTKVLSRDKTLRCVSDYGYPLFHSVVWLLKRHVGSLFSKLGWCLSIPCQRDTGIMVWINSFLSQWAAYNWNKKKWHGSKSIRIPQPVLLEQEQAVCFCQNTSCLVSLNHKTERQ